uniref:Calpain-1 catalytic subunit-like n=1 Tax=Sinocyclocheilus anshuiensis TaxID=1608454 RepID=A0A671QVJ7_9TELE
HPYFPRPNQRKRRFLGQDYQKLLQKSLRRNELYTDELFPPNSSSIGTLNKEADLDYKNVIWKRPAVLSPGKPFFTVDGMSRFDYEQGSKLVLAVWEMD